MNDFSLFNTTLYIEEGTSINTRQPSVNQPFTNILRRVYSRKRLQELGKDYILWMQTPLFRIYKHTSQELKQTTISWVIYLSICVTYEILNYPCTERKNKKFRSNTELRPSKYKLFCKHFITQVFLAILPNIPFSYFSKYLQSFLKWLSKGFGLLLLEDVTQPTFT